MFHSDSDIQRKVADELKWDPSLEDDDIAVAVRNGDAPGITDVENELTVDPTVPAAV